MWTYHSLFSQYLAKTLVTDAIFYEKPLVSLSLFVSWMHCVYSASVRLAPVYFVGYLIFHLFDNYERYNGCETSHLGYAPLTLQELLYSLVFAPGNGGHMNSVNVTKRIVSLSDRWKLSESNLSDHSEDVGVGEIQPLNHREFPFSERVEYPRFRAEDATVPSKNPISRSKRKLFDSLYSR